MKVFCVQPPQTAREGVTGQVQLLVGQVTDSGWIFKLKIPLLTAALILGFNVLTRNQVSKCRVISEEANCT